jgi:hypothetical protein
MMGGSRPTVDALEVLVELLVQDAEHVAELNLVSVQAVEGDRTGELLVLGLQICEPQLVGRGHGSGPILDVELAFSGIVAHAARLSGVEVIAPLAALHPKSR